MHYRRYIGLFYIALFLLFSTAASAQSTAGITGEKDTSFTVYKELQKNIKKYPFIKIAEATQTKSVKGKTNIFYTAVGARKLALDVFYPRTKSNNKRIAIMIIHGGGWRSGSKEQHHALAQRLAALGYVCFTPEYRLSTEALYPAAVLDLKAALHWIKVNAKSYGVDTSKIVVAGFSAGGMLATLLGTTVGNPIFDNKTSTAGDRTNISAIINIDGTLSFVHPESGEGDDSKKTSAATYWFGWSKNENPQIWKEASPLSHAGPNTPPTLFINSSVDRMHAGRDDFQKILKEHGIYSEVKTFSDAPHAFPLFHPWFDPMIQTMDAFLKKVFATQNISKTF